MTTPKQAPQMTQAHFFSLRVIKALQQIQKENPYGSKAHRDAFKRMQEVAKTIGADLGEY